MLRLRTLFSRKDAEAYRCAVVFPRYTETRYLERLPSPGSRIRDQWGNGWIVAEVLQSGRRTYTVFAGEIGEYRESLLRSGDGIDLTAELVNLAGQSAAAATRKRRRWKSRHYLP